MTFLQRPSLHNSLIREIRTVISPEGQFNIFLLRMQEADSEVVIISYSPANFSISPSSVFYSTHDARACNILRTYFNQLKEKKTSCYGTFEAEVCVNLSAVHPEALSPDDTGKQAAPGETPNKLRAFNTFSRLSLLSRGAPPDT